ncbi:hypothetical protein [Caballeronia sp. ATUFL_M2_KS44]|uniref:hypothetical protein n=1 Tax=Caballeronia sp. ATUFL_M2_KS44 TaxID=2921767 RepID=UPI002027912E|nr:hypothetical protein [Caballeronia sp. ATUFL_M2_KS44]
MNLDLVESDFRKHFCVGMSTERCDRRWDNISPLMSKLSTDPAVPTVGTAAYMLATTFVETGIADFDPGTVERMPADGSKPKYYPWIGRGWVQLTYENEYRRASLVLQSMEQFKGQDVDLLKNPDLARKPELSYVLLVQAMTQGLLEHYRVSAAGGCGPNNDKCIVPIRISDFVNASKADYGHARAVINADCVNPLGRDGRPVKGGKQPCANIIYEDKGYIPDAGRLDAGPLAASQAAQFEAMLCKGMGLGP